MDWATGSGKAEESSWNNEDADNWGDENSNSKQNTDTFADETFNGEKQVGHSGDNACRNCGDDGHFTRDCPQEKKMAGECFNCGEVGHNKVDCPNPRTERPFSGICRTCNKEGHRSAECPDASPQTCKNCQKEGHKAAECKENRAVDLSDVPDMTALEAWALLEHANRGPDNDSLPDMDDFKTAVKIYSKANPDVTFDQLEAKFREAKFRVYLIAMEKEVHKSLTLVNLQGKADCKYAISYQYGPKPKRAKYAEGWPSNPQENSERLKDAGMPMEQILPLCRNCNELGHISKNCPEDKVEVERIEIICSNCNEAGHRMRDCPKPRSDPNQCKNCKQQGHKAADCTEPRSAEGVECRKCNETGHFASDCPNAPTRSCHNCGDADHMSKDCDKPRNPENTTCRNCDQKGHFSRDCPAPKDWSRVKCSNCGEMGHTIKRCTQSISGERDVEAEATHDKSPVVAEGNWMQASETVDSGW